MNATQRVLLGALLGAGVTASVAVPLSGTEAAYTDSEQVIITVVAEVPGAPTTATRSAVAAVQQFVATVGNGAGAAAIPGAAIPGAGVPDAGISDAGISATAVPDGPAASVRRALPGQLTPSEPAPTQPVPTEPAAQPGAQPPADPSAEPTAVPGADSADAGPGADGAAGE